MMKLDRTATPGLYLCLCCVLFFSLLSSSCTPTCDYPNSRFAKIRLINALPDQEQVSVWLNGKLFRGDYPYDPPADFGYYSTLIDGSPIGVGETRVVATRDNKGLDTIVSATVTINVNEQTLIIGGRANALASEPDTKRILLLDDQIQTKNDQLVLIRFIDLLPDFPSLDVYWDSTAWNTKKPNTTLTYGTVPGYTNYIQNDALRITEAGHPEHLVFTIPYVFNQPGFLITALLRGRSKPLGNERTVSFLPLADGNDIGNNITNFETFGVRMMNATRSQALSLYIRSPQDIVSNKSWDARGNYPGQQQTVVDIASDSLSGYLALTQLLNGTSTYFFSKQNDNARTDLLDSVTVTGVHSDERYTIVAVEKSLFGTPTTSLDHIAIKDTISLPHDSSFNRVRIIAANTDHQTISVTFGGKPISMNFKDVAYFDVRIGAQQLQLSDGAATGTIPVTISAGRPVSIYLLPKQSAGVEFPVQTIIE
jgi:hypothetical protein